MPSWLLSDMDSTVNINDAGLYTDFSGLSRLKVKASAQPGTAESQQATKEVAKQFESIFLQMMLKSMRDASDLSESTESDQTRFYMDMFDKQISLDLASSGNGIGLAEMLERDLGDNQNIKSQPINSQSSTEQEQQLLRQQIERSTSMLSKADILNVSGEEK